MAENRELALVLKLVADQFQNEMKKSGGVVGEFQKFIGDWRTQLTLAGTALFAIAKSTANFGEEALKSSQRLGLMVETTTALKYAAHLADVPMSTLEVSLKKLSQNAVEAAAGTGEGAKLFASLGISATEASGKIKPLDQLLFEFQDRLRGVDNQAQFVDAGVKAFGRSFLEIVPFIKQGSAATKEAMEEGRKLGATMSGEQAQAASRFNDELKRLDAQLMGVKFSIGNALIPTMRELIELFRTVGVGPGLGEGLKFIHFNLLAINTAIKDLQAGSQWLFGKGKDALTFEQFRGRLAENEASAKRSWFEAQHPGVLSTPGNVLSGGAGGTGGALPGGGSTIAASDADHDAKLAKALNEIWQTNQRSLEIQDRQFGEVIAQWGERTRVIEAIEARQREAREAGVKALTEYAEAEFKRDDEMLAHAAAVQEARGVMIRDSTKLEVHLREQALAEQVAANRTFFDEWKIGMDKYVRDTNSGFGLGADLARRTAQTMEQSFRQLFFDVWDRKIENMADVLESLGDFAKQVLGTVFSQLATKAVLSSFGFGGSIPAFASGGAVFGPTLALVGENASRSNPEYIGHANQLGLGSGLNLTFIVNNQSGAEVGQPVVSQGPDGRRIIEMTIKNAVRGMIQGGDMDKSMYQRFGLNPVPGRR